MITKRQRIELHLVTLALVNLKHRCGQAGLFRTMHKMDLATQEVGWEIADILKGKQTIPDG